MISGLNWERFPKVWLLLGGDIETGSAQNHAAAETEKLHSNPLLPKLVCSAFSWKYGSMISGSHISPNISTWSLLVKWDLHHGDLPFTLPNQPEFLRLWCNRKELLGISSATLWFLNSQEFSTCYLSIFYSYQGRECGQVWGGAVSQTIFYQELIWKLATVFFKFLPYESLCRLLIS